MKIRLAFTLISIFYFSGIAFSQPLHEHNSHAVIIDTDCAIDDMRAISLLLSRPEITIKAIVTCDGSIPPKEGVQKIHTLLHEFKADSIPVALGDDLPNVAPPWREFNRQFTWGTAIDNIKPILNSFDCLVKNIENSKEKTILICLGPLTNIEKLVKEKKSILNNIERIIWYNGYVKPLSGFNYEYDKEAAEIVFGSGIRIDVISNLNYENSRFDSALYEVCVKSTTVLASVFSKVHSQPIVYKRLMQKHFNLCDELVSIYLTNPELFGITPLMGKTIIRHNQEYNENGVREVIIDMINGNYAVKSNVVFNSFPVQREMFNYDVRPIIDTAIALYGMDEWKANVMTDEFHGHLGVFSIVGAKMGIRAREYFGVGSDMLKVVAYAGTKPPYSCLIDGIQVSTGATLGMGTIKLSDDIIAKPSAVFSYQNKSIRITLKPEYLKMVDADIAEGIVKFGLMDDGYWKLIRQNALKYWVEWDRNQIFEVTEVNQ